MQRQINEKTLSKRVDHLTEKAIEALDTAASNESRYLIFRWSPSLGKLEIGLADYDKKNEFSLLVEECYTELVCDQESEDLIQIEELLRFWLTDFLSSCSGFLRYSLIALFHTGDPSKSRLL